MDFDVIVETKQGNHLILAKANDRQYGAMVCEALYEHYKNASASALQIRYVWLRDISNPSTPHLMDAWPAAWQDQAGYQASLEAWKKSPRDISGDESEPSTADAWETIEEITAKLPKRYQPIAQHCENQRFTLYVNHTQVFRDQPAREAILRARSYVEEHERAGWTLPTGVVDGNYE